MKAASVGAQVGLGLQTAGAEIASTLGGVVGISMPAGVSLESLGAMPLAAWGVSPSMIKLPWL